MKEMRLLRFRQYRLSNRFLSVFLTLIACGLMLTSAYFFRPDTNQQFLTEAALSFLLGVFAFGGALWLSADKLKTLVPASIPLTPARSHWWKVGIGALLLALVAESSGRALHIPLLNGMSVHIQFGLLVAGVMFVGWGFAGDIRLSFASIDPKTVLVVGFITLLGLTVRVWGLNTTARFMQDETVFTDALMQFWHGGNPGILNGGGLATITMIYPYWNVGSVEVFGRNLIGLRMASALLGTLAIPVAYGLASALFGKKFGFVAALFVATFPPHVHFSRISWGHIGDSLMGLTALMFAVRGIRWNRRVDWAFGGVALGFTQYFFEVGRLLYPPLLFVWFILLALGWKLQSYRRGLLIGMMAALLVAAPVYYAIAVRGAFFTPRLESSGVGLDYWIDLFERSATDGGSRFTLLNRLKTPFLVYTHQPDSLAEYYGGFAGFVPPQLVPLFSLGVAFLVWRVRYPIFVLLLALLLVSSANLFAKDGGIAARYVIVAPIIPILMAVGLYAVLRLLSVKWRWLLYGLAILVALWQVYFYFGVHLPYYNEQRRQRSPERDIFDAVLRTPDLPPNTQVFLIDPAPSIDYGRANRLYLFLQDAPFPIQAPSRLDFDPLTLPRNCNYAFFVAPDDSETIDKVRRAFPDVQAPQYTTYPVPEWDQYVLLLWLMNDG